MAILRHAPGEVVPVAGTYALVSHFGEPTGFATRFDEGERLPLVAATKEGPHWYVLVDTGDEDSKAA